MLKQGLEKKFRLGVSLFVILQCFSNHFASCYDSTNALLRSQTKDFLPEPQVNISININDTNMTESDSSSDVDNGTSPQLLNPDYDSEPDTNKTKRSKAAIRWLKSTLGLGSGSGETATSETDTEGQTEMPSSSDQESEVSTDAPAPGSSILTSIVDPFHIKRKLASKVSSVYQTVAGAIGIGGGGGSSPMEPSDDETDDNTNKASENKGTRDGAAAAGDDESGTANLSSSYNYIYVFLFAGYLSVVMNL